MQQSFTNRSNAIVPLLLITITALFSESCAAFTVAPSRKIATKNIVSLQATFPRRYGADDNNDAMARNKKRTCVRHFLTQRAVQSFMFLSDNCRDPHTADWIQNVAGLTNLLEYHGTGAFNFTTYPYWDSFLLDLMSLPEEKIIIQTRGHRSFGGGSRNNPYVQQNFVEYEIDIDPTSLATRIISVREQLAKEWLQDLDLVVEANERVLSSYLNNVKHARDSVRTNDDDDDDEGKDKKRKEEKEEEGPIDLLQERAIQQVMAFEKVRLDTLMESQESYNFMNGIGPRPSPLRKSSLDLLLLLTMQESIHRVLRNFKGMGEKKEVSFEWLRDFYIKRVSDLFDGFVKYGNADQFLEELLLTPPSMKHTNDGKIGLVDPHGVAEEIIRTRTEVACEWKDIMMEVPSEHMMFRKALFDKQMENWAMPSDTNKHNVPIQTEGIFE